MVLALGEARPSEASVERSYNKHGEILTPKRNRLSNEATEGCLRIDGNYEVLFGASPHDLETEELLRPT